MEKCSFKIKGETLNYWYFKGPSGSPILHWAHGNGLNAPTYFNLLDRLSRFCTVYAWDARSHGLNTNLASPKIGETYSKYSEDLIELINHLYNKHKQRIIIAGHSFGGTLCVRVEHALKDKISKLILADPVLFTRVNYVASLILRAIKFKYPRALYLAQNAKNREYKWSNTKEVIRVLGKKNLFKNWDELSLENYVKYGTKSLGEDITLSCPPSVESQIFKDSEKEMLVKKISNLSTNTYIFLAAKGSPAFAKRAIEKSPFVLSQLTIEKSNHMFPIEMYKEFSNEIHTKVFKSTQN